MYLTRKAIPRRALLKSAQAALALPLLEAMIPAAPAWAQTPAKPGPRLGFVFIPMGKDHTRGTRPDAFTSPPKDDSSRSMLCGARTTGAMSATFRQVAAALVHAAWSCSIQASLPIRITAMSRAVSWTCRTVSDP